MDFTREPIIETVITPKEGWKLVVRSSKNSSQEEHFVDAVEVVTFGQSQFYRTLERPKCFLLPVGDFEILEVREARVVLKNVSVDRNIKIGGGRDAMKSAPKEAEEKVQEPAEKSVEKAIDKPVEKLVEKGEGRGRRQRRFPRRRRGKDGVEDEGNSESMEEGSTEGEVAREIPIPRLIAPPSTLISETLSRYREDETYAKAFYQRGEEQPDEDALQDEPTEKRHIESDADFDEGDHFLFDPENSPREESSDDLEDSLHVNHSLDIVSQSDEIRIESEDETSQ